MSFETLNKDVLLQVAEEFAVDVKPTATKKQIVASLLEDGVDWDMYKQAFPDVEDIPDEPVNEEEEVKPVATEDKAAPRPVPTVLVKMERHNPRFEIRGYTFKKEHPFVPVTEEDANYIISNLDGFRIAMPREAEEFYS